MKRLNRLLLLLGVLMAVSAAALLITHTEKKKEEIRNTDEVILSVDTQQVEKLSWEYADTSLSFHKEDDVWYWDDDKAFPVNADSIDRLLKLFADFGAAFVIENVDDYGQYGLNDPVCTIRITTPEKLTTVTLGAFSTMDEQRYVTIGDGKVYLVRTDPMDSYEITLREMLQRDATPTYDTVTELAFTGAENYTIFREENSPDTYCNDDRYFTERGGKTVPLDTGSVGAYASALHTLDLTDYVTYNATEEELDACGLKTPQLTATMSYTEEDDDGSETAGAFTVSIGKDKEESAAQQQAEAAGEEYDGTVTAYLRIGDSPIIYRLSETDYKMLAAAGYDDLRHPEVLTASFTDVNELDIILDGESYTFVPSVPEEDDEEAGRIYTWLGEEIDIDSVTTAVEALTAISFTDEKPVKKQEIALTFHLNNENHSTVQVELYRYDGQYCLAVVDGAPVSLVSRALTVDLIEAVNRIILG